MKESFTREKSSERVSYHEGLVGDLNIPSAKVAALTEMFQLYAKEKGASLRDEHLIVRTIRHFLNDRKPEIKQRFAGSVLGQSGCFPFSVRSCLLAGSLGVESSLARSTRTRALHVMLVDKDGTPYDPRELTKGDIKPMSTEQVQAYSQYLQPIVAAVDAMRRGRTPVRKGTSRPESIIPIIPCNEEVEA